VSPSLSSTSSGSAASPRGGSVRSVQLGEVAGGRAPGFRDREAVAACRRVLEEKSKSFSLAAKLLPSALRDEIAVVYAYCRHVDDAIDGVPADAREAALVTLRAELDAVYGDAAPIQENAMLVAFAEVARSRALPRRYCEELLAGMEMDVLGQRYETLDDLLLYCYRVAGVVGLMLCHVMGLRDERALPRAAHLGIAMQLTNICRDVAEDRADGRVYLPSRLLELDLLAPAATSGARPEAQITTHVKRTVRTLLGEADRYYASADRGIAALPFRCALAIHAARLVYAAIGDRLLAAGGDPLLGRTVVPTSHKLWLVVCAVGRSLRELPARLVSRGPRLPPRTVLDFSDDILVPR
jgi:15-cis-phytoene synthase